ncbi:MAG: flagellar basal-body rod protein FlgG [Acidobacteriota bacterium]|jgi:flagellar basal-body rod protein FlgG|nr:flagellar basal-body rod protein FlgG [Acidobacteriota bacterium]
MLRAMYTAATGMQAQELNIDTIAHNLANINTTGFKSRRAEFHDLVYQNMRQAGVSATATTEIPVSLQVGLGTRPVATEMNLKQGDFMSTGSSLDMVIRGQGFFQIRKSDGEIAYTRNGNFHLNSEGNIVTSEGDLLDPQITIPEDQTDIYIGADGIVSVTTAGQTTPQQVGQIQLATFQNPVGLESVGDSMFLQTEASGEPITGTPGDNGLGTLLSGYVEQSNVSVVEEMVAMIVSQRAYEANSKVISTADDMFSTGNNIVR